MNKDNYHFFWSGPFSQWAKSDFTVPSCPGIVFNTAEQYMMYSKAKLFGDKKTAEKILATKNPREQKALGREIANFNKDLWEFHAPTIVYTGNLFKYMQNPELLRELLMTGNKYIVEASPHDAIWGIGFDEEHTMENFDKWGTNWLGEALIRVRHELSGF